MPHAAERQIILCVEDEPTLLRDLCDELDDAGYHAIGVTDVTQAQQMLMTWTPALILCDITLPGASGIDFVTELRRTHALPDVPFVFLTALADRDHMLKGRLSGADDYLVKPVDYDMLLASIASRLAQVGRMKDSYQTRLLRQTHELLFQWTNVLDKVNQCALVCGAGLEVRFANRAAYSLCRAAGDGPLAVDAAGRMHLNPMIARHPEVQAFLRGNAESLKIDQGAKGAAGEQSWQVWLLALNERTESPPSAANTPSQPRDETFVVFLADLNQRHLPNKAALARRFQLTPTEVQVASLLADGLTKQEMCEQMQVTTTTMAFHLRNLFSKTHTKRQAELVALLMSVAWNNITLTTPDRG